MIQEVCRLRSAQAFGAREVHLIDLGPFDPAPAKGAFKAVPPRFFEDFAECYRYVAGARIPSVRARAGRRYTALRKRSSGKQCVRARPRRERPELSPGRLSGYPKSVHPAERGGGEPERQRGRLDHHVRVCSPVPQRSVIRFPPRHRSMCGTFGAIESFRINTGQTHPIYLSSIVFREFPCRTPGASMGASLFAANFDLLRCSEKP